IQHVYGAQHPPFDPLLHANLIKAGNKPPPATPGKPKKATTFQEFESITSDAWDVGDDDDELLAMAAQNLNIEVVMETANMVIENHSKQQERQRQDDSTESGQREEDAQEEVVAEEEEEEEEDEYLRVEEVDAISPDASFASQSSPYTDSRLVKSHSEAPIGSPKALNMAAEHLPVSERLLFKLSPCLDTDRISSPLPPASVSSPLRDDNAERRINSNIIFLSAWLITEAHVLYVWS
ncbi:hypothetical protein GOODEAATRI_017897, partial [Goodea atripinnis]